MINKMRILRKNLNSGFTLVELMVVVAVIAVLVAIAVPIFSGSAERVKDNTDLANLRILNGVTTVYRSTIGDNDPFSSSEDSEALMELLVPDFIAEEPRPQQEEIQFSWNLAEQRWTIDQKSSEGEPGVPGGENGDGNNELPASPETEETDEQAVGYYTIGSAEDNLKLVRHSGIQQLVGPYTGTATDITIPATLNGVVIDGIWQHAFRVHYGSTKEKLKSVSFADDSQIKIIGGQAFINNLLTDISLPESLETIGDRAFRSNQFTEITFPDKTKSIGEKAFELNPNLNKITIGVDVTIGNDAFGSNNFFRDAYELGGAGTYLYIDGVWVKQ